MYTGYTIYTYKHKIKFESNLYCISQNYINSPNPT